MKRMIKETRYAVILLVLLLGACKSAPETKDSHSLPRSIPEIEGVSSQGIMTFLDSLAVSRHEFHSFMILRHGRVIAEGWWDPYKPDLKHTLYSTSKSFTSTAVGFAVSDSLLSVNDKVISFFPADLPAVISPFLADMTVKDLLMMSAGQEPDPTFGVVVSDTNWVKAFLALPVVNDPGTKFLYNSLATYMLSAIVQKVTGEKVIDYLTLRLFDPLGIEGADWEVDPRGINTGGWGLRLKTEDMAKFGQLYLQKGNWNGKQILPSAWVEEATTFKIDQAPDAAQSRKDSSDWMQGYCYQFWRCRNNAFRADGAFGQYIIVMPDQDAVVAIQSESPDMQDEINLVWKYLLPDMKKEALAENKEISDKLAKRLSALALPLPSSAVTTPDHSAIAGRTFALDPNEAKMESVSFGFDRDTCQISLKINGTDYKLAFGSGKWVNGETGKLGPNLVKPARAHFSGLPPAKIAGSYGWKDEKTLELVLRYIESPHSERLTCTFDKDDLKVEYAYSFAFGGNLMVVKGKGQ
jgi:CubicO group peptidase (beta-lactamase class C family)